MVAAVTSAAPTLNLEPGTLNSARWQPTGDDHLIFEWVKMQGKTQCEVASMFGIDQSTVSRVIQRMERWQAHAKARENGRLDPQERLRAQRWLTYERNELILASCLRIAQEMEGFTDVSKTTISRPISKPSQEREIRTQNSTIDQHGIAARFLRLAFRINMDQLKLAAQIAREGEAPAEPLSAEELAEETRQAAADAAELANARQRSREWAQSEIETHPTPDDDPVGCVKRTSSDALDVPTPPPPPDVAPAAAPGEPANLTVTLSPSLPPSVTPSSVALHNLHTQNPPEIAATDPPACTCAPQPSPQENLPCSCIIELSPEKPIEFSSPQAPQHRPALAPAAVP
jgi:hypothetical protein